LLCTEPLSSSFVLLFLFFIFCWLVLSKKTKKETMRATPKTLSLTESSFTDKCNQALQHAKKLLHDTKHCSMAEQIPHSFQDKFGLVEVVTRLSVAAQYNALMILLGLSPSSIQNLREKSQASKKSVSLRFESEENCEFKFHDQVEQKSHVHSTTSFSGLSSKKEYTITKIDRYHWEFSYSYRLFAFLGSDPKDELVCLTNGTGTYKFFTHSKEPAPRPEAHLCHFPDLNISWLLEHSAQEEEGGGDLKEEGEEKIIEEAQMGVFSINRFAASCRTPTRNDEIDEAWEFAHKCSEFWEVVRDYFHGNLFPFYTSKTHSPGVGSQVDAADIFVPLLPIFRDALSPETSSASSDLRLSGLSLSSSSLPDIDEHQTSALVHHKDRSLELGQQTRLLQLQCRNLAEKVSALKRTLPEVHANAASQTDGKLAVAGAHMTHICDTFMGCVRYMESLLRKQLIITIGRELTPVDFDNYMLFHNHRIFREEYAPKIMSYQVRTGGRPSEGTFSLLPLTPRTNMSFQRADPYKTFVSHDIPREPFQFAINSATNVSVQGERYLHSMVLNSFSGSPGVGMRLNVRSRPFCNFIVIAGRMTSNQVLDPEIATVVQRKDELDILLKTDPIPAPKAFRDAIASLSPEMQRFAKAYRSMQLSSTLFGVCILEIKPQVERALALPEGSLYKETELMDDVIDLFLEYNIPADLMSFDGFDSDHPDVKVARVKELVSEIQTMIKTEKEALLPPPPPPSAPSRFSFFGGGGMGGPPPMPGMGGGGPPGRGGGPRGRGGGPRGRGGGPRGRGGGPRGRGGGPRGRGGGPVPRSARGAAPRGKGAARGGAPPRPGANSAPPPPPAAAGGPPPPPPPPAAAGGPPPPPSAPSPAPVDAPAPKPESKPQEKKEMTPSLEGVGSSLGGQDRDITTVPMELDGKFDELDPDGAVRPTIINFDGDWWFKSFESILSPPKVESVGSSDQGKKKNKAFDLLDSITRSGALPYVGGQLHVVTALTHCFEDSLINTLWLESVNPIERVEATGLIAASVIHQASPLDLVVDSAQERIKKYSRGVFDALENEHSKKK